MTKDEMNNERSHDLNLADLLEEIDDEIARQLNEQQDDTPESTDETELKDIGRHICFNIADRQLAIPLSFVSEVGELQVVQPLPFLPDWLEGITNIRGEIISVINLAGFLDIADMTPKKGQTFIIVHDDKMKTAIIVEKITGTRLLFRKKNMDFISGSLGTLSSEFVTGPAVFSKGNVEQVVEVLNMKKLLSSTRVK